MLRIGILGGGNLAQTHIDLLLQCEDKFEIVGFFEPNDEKASALEVQFSLKRFSSADELIKLVDCVDLLTPIHKRYEMAALAMRNSKHIFIEKPIARNMEEARSLVNLSREANVKVQVGSLDRFNPAYLSALKELGRPLFIRLQHETFVSDPENTRASALDLLIDDVDLVLSTVKSGIRKVSASAHGFFSEQFDFIDVRIEFDNGCVANFTANTCAVENKLLAQFFQKDRIVEIDFLSNQLKYTKKEAQIGGVCKDSVPVIISNPLQDEFLSFYTIITEDKEPIVSLEDGYASLAVIHRIFELLNHSTIEDGAQ